MVHQAVAWLADRVPLAAGSRILEVGAGPGYATALLAEAFPHSEVIGVDPTAPFVARAAERFTELRLGERVRRTVRRTPHAMLVRAHCPLWQMWCQARSTPANAGRTLLVQLCTTVESRSGLTSPPHLRQIQRPRHQSNRNWHDVGRPGSSAARERAVAGPLVQTI